MENKPRILVAPLNWGLGHATRCIPIIQALLEHNFTPIIASDGAAFNLLQKEFPDLEFMELLSYNIKYAKKGTYFKLKLILNSPKWLAAVKREQSVIKKLVKSGYMDGIISDNRLGVYSKKVPSVFISHQLNVLSGNTSWFSSKMHQNIIKKFDECWVPDLEGDPNLSGKLGHLNHKKLNLKYIGPISRFKKVDCNPVFDLMVLLSGPEPQRTLLEEKLLSELKDYMGSVLFVKGILEDKQIKTIKNNLTVYNYMTSDELERSINQSKRILSRSGYTTVLDLAKLEKKAFFIPTPGQFEQEYLAKRLDKLGLVPTCKQDEFTLEKLKQTENYKGLTSLIIELNFKELFGLFERKGKLTANT